MARNFKKEQAEKVSTRAVFGAEDRFWFLWKLQRRRPDGQIEVHPTAGENGRPTFLARAFVVRRSPDGPSEVARDPKTNAILPGGEACAWAARFPGWELVNG